MSEQNVQVIQNAYAAFQRNDIDGLMAFMADDIDWQFFGPKELPMAGPRKGKTECLGFFKQVGEAWNFAMFEPKQFIAQGDIVVGLGSYSGTAKNTGRKFDCQWSHVFTVRDGKVARFREYTDTANLLEAYAGAPMRV